MGRHSFLSTLLAAARGFARRVLADLDRTLSWYTDLVGWNWHSTGTRRRRKRSR